MPGISVVTTFGAAAWIASRIAWNLSPPTQNAEMYSAAVGSFVSLRADAQSFSTFSLASTVKFSFVSLIGVSSFSCDSSDTTSASGSVCGILSSLLAAIWVMTLDSNAGWLTTDNSCQLAFSIIITPSSL